MNNLKAKTSHLKIKEIRQHVGLEYIAAKKFPDLPEQEAIDGTIELWKNFRGFMKEFFVLRGNENDYKGKYLEGFYKNPRWWAGLYDGDKIVGTEYFTYRGNRMFSGFLFADSREIAQELITQLYELSKVTLPKLDIIESIHFTNVDEYDLSYREETGYRAWAWLDEKDVRGNDCRVSFLKKVRSEWEERNND
tara:strand:- start:272 stop:850 length:579 start_codon:yes stop_codon:yes gene_type:complete